ncbi:hypothetical protein KC19_VG309100 [Ceratodon purpureus]|uniref:Uncharacterized protein n=1 Tax=Ceratodon purpureus TaxID=3225 RepID=A0A8T0HV90_CERPU|nr:hypothetical protein KC19_VG309100 [Ceratodon purpureus]
MCWSVSEVRREGCFLLGVGCVHGSQVFGDRSMSPCKRRMSFLQSAGSGRAISFLHLSSMILGSVGSLDLFPDPFSQARRLIGPAQAPRLCAPLERRALRPIAGEFSPETYPILHVGSWTM